jgi:hypothetical protein
MAGNRCGLRDGTIRRIFNTHIAESATVAPLGSHPRVQLSKAPRRKDNWNAPFHEALGGRDRLMPELGPTTAYATAADLPHPGGGATSDPTRDLRLGRPDIRN